MKKYTHSSQLEIPWNQRPEQNFKLNRIKDVKKLPVVELSLVALGTSSFAGFILYLEPHV
jgi:hypothetical protein